MMNATSASRIALLACAALLLTGATGFSQTGSQDKLISMEVRNEPLGDVLNRMATVTGCRFTVDDQWAAVPVSAMLNEFPLDRALKRVLRDFDNIIIYHSDRTVEIRIFGMADTREKRSARSSVYTLPAYPAAPESEAVESVDEPAEEQTGTTADTQEAGPDITEKQEGKTAIESRESEEGKSPGESAGDKEEAGSQTN